MLITSTCPFKFKGLYSTPVYTYALAAIHRTFYSLGIDHDYARLLLSEVSFTREEIRISGSKAILARTAADDLGNAMPTVLSFVRD